MEINKKAQLFTLVVTMLALLLFISFELYSILQSQHTIKERVKTMNNFLYALEKNMERRMYIIGFRMIFLAENEIATKGHYINPQEFFQEAFFNGTVEGKTNSFLEGATYDDLIESINQKANKINVRINITNSVINFSQEDPWRVKFTMDSHFIMEDKSGLARWEKDQHLVTYIPITTFEDPIFIVDTLGKVSRKINQTIYEGEYRSGNDSTNLSLHVENGLYAANPYAPSFLKRLAGDLSADENGIESFVVLPELSKQGLAVKNKSCIDYIYFSQRNPPIQSVEGMPSWFLIDSEDNHTTKYQIT